MFIEYLSKNPQFFCAVCVTVIVSVCLHELAHGVVAMWFGDRTPIETGHMTPNPVVHMGAMSLLLLALAGIAWGQMPVNPRRMRGRHAPAAVAIAGPITNLLLATIALASLGLWVRWFGPFARTATTSINLAYFILVFGQVNLALALFNCIPIPPLDGSHVLGHFSPSYTRLTANLQQQMGIAFLVLFIFGGPFLFQASDWLAGKLLLCTRGF